MGELSGEWKGIDLGSGTDWVVIWVCRNVPGEHVGGPGCWCSPYQIDPFDEVAAARFQELAEHPERQVDG